MSEDEPGGMTQLLPQIYEQLRRVAQELMSGERPGHTLSATALVHEACLRLSGPRVVPWRDRAHLHAAAAEAMRRVLIDHARARGRAKRGGGWLRFDLDGGTIEFGAVERPDSAPDDLAEEFLALDNAIRRLEERDPRMGQVVRLRFYAGLGVAEVAAALGVSERTVKSDWSFARAWLGRELSRDGAPDEPGPSA